MAVTDAVDQALMAALLNDATLTALAPGRVHRSFEPEAAAPGRCVIVTLQHEAATEKHGATAFYQTQYAVKVVDQAPTKTAAQAAADRIDAILLGAPLTISGQTHMLTRRVERFEEVERVGSAIWQHVGADYEVWSTPTP